MICSCSGFESIAHTRWSHGDRRNRHLPETKIAIGKDSENARACDGSLVDGRRAGVENRFQTMGEPDVSDLLTVQQAIRILDGVEVSSRVVHVPLHEAQGLFLAQDLVADRDYPPFDKSLMDGY